VKLYDNPISGNCYKVRLLCALLDIEYERVTVDVLDRSDPRDELATLNPARRIPTLVLDDGRPIAESNAIIWYLGEGTRYVPDERYERAKVQQWLFFEQYEHEPAIAVARFLMTYYDRPEIWESQRDQLTKKGVKALRMLEEGLYGRDWLVGDSMTIADIALYAYTHVAHEGGFVLDDFPAIREWLGRITAQPGHVPIS
jgi:glutathione S-transferase